MHGAKKHKINKIPLTCCWGHID